MQRSNGLLKTLMGQKVGECHLEIIDSANPSES